MDRYESRLDETFEAALETGEIQEAHAAPELLQKRLRLVLQDRRKDLLAQASEPIARVDSLQKEVERVRETARARAAPTSWAVPAMTWGSAAGLVIVVVVVGLVLLTRAGISLPGILRLDPPLGTTWILVIGIFVGLMLLGVIATAAERRAARRETWIGMQEEELGLKRAQHELEQANERLRKYLRDEVVLPCLREEIRKLEPPDERTEIRRLDRTGLVEVHDLQFQVPTPAHEQLDRLVRETRSGTIGVSGSRGAGKTSLLRYFCRPDLPDTPLDDKRVRVFVSAPVDYAARDFVLHIFSELCYGVCETVGVERSAFRATSADGDDREMERFRQRVRWARGKWLSRVLFAGALILLVLSATGLVSELSQGAAAERGAAEPETAEARPAGRNGGTSPVEGAAEGGESTSAPARPEAVQGQPLTAFLRANKKPLFDYALGLAFLAALVFWGLPYLARTRSQEMTLGPGWTRPPAPMEIRNGGPQAARWAEAYRLALEHLENIHFQQSFTSGWKGALSTPLLNVDHSLDRSLSARQQSLPDIMSSFRTFVENLPTRRPVIIAIDELDKMASADKAERFLNDVKSIFGIPRCVYVVSVSLQAMSRFNRRGLPFRDTFDSAFDEVVHVRYFDLGHSTSLLNRRVIGLPPAFHALCHLFAGGLPRDLIRACRGLLTLRDSVAQRPDEPVPLDRLCDEMIREEVRAKLDAMEVEALSPGSQAPPAMLMECLRDILNGDMDLRGVACEVRASLVDPPEKDAAGGEVVGPSEEVAPPVDAPAAVNMQGSKAGTNLFGALAAYLYYLATVRELMARASDSGSPPSTAAVDRLAGIRADIGVDPELAWQRISGTRQTLRLDVAVP